MQSESASLLKASEEEVNFEIQKNCLIYDIFNEHENYIFCPIPKEDNQLDIVTIYDIEIFSRDTAKSYTVGFYPV